MNPKISEIDQAANLYNAGRFSEARVLLERAVEANPNNAKALSLLAGSLAALGETDSAFQYIEQALQLGPKTPMIQVMAGHVHTRANQLDKAENHLRQANSLMPNHSGTLFSLGHNLLAQGRYKDALEFLQKAANLNPSIPELKQEIAAIYWQLQDYETASQILSEILAESPNDVLALNELGLVRKSQGRIQDAITLFRKAVAIDPRHDLANKNLGISLQEIGNADEAAEHFDKYEQINSTIEVSLLNALVLPVVLGSTNVIDKWRGRLVDGMTRVANSGETLDDPLRQIGQDHFHLAYHGRNDKEIQTHIANTYLKIAPSIGFQAPYIAPVSSRDRIKVGFVSSRLYNHTVGHLNLGYIKHLDRSKFEVQVISPESKKDSIRKKIESAADAVHLVPRFLDKARSVIANENYDLVYYPDIGMETFSYFMAFARLAPVQAVAWGHPVTTGIPSIDYFVTCDLMEPDNAEEAYSEELIRLPDVGGYYYRPNEPSGPLDRDRYNLPEDRTLIVCVQGCFKFHPDFDPILKAVLTALPESVLVLLDFQSDQLGKRLEKTLGPAFSQVRFSGPFNNEDYLRLAKEADVILDIPQWSGGRSSYESLAMGTPIVHQPGEFMRGRHTLAFYKTMGVTDCVVETDEEYVDLTVRLVRDPIFRERVRRDIVLNVDKLFERPTAVTALENFFIDAVSRSRL